MPWELWEKRSPCGGKAQVARRPPVALGIVALWEDVKETPGWIVQQAQAPT